MTEWWLVWRYLTGGGSFLSRKKLNITSTIALSGMILGVASLVITMSVVSGVESLLKTSIMDVTGHIMLWKTGGVLPSEDLESQVKKISPEILAVTPFVHQEAVLAHLGQVSGVVIQGFDSATVEQVLNFRPRVVAGVYDLTPGEFSAALMGKELAKRFKLNVGDTFQLVVPKRSFDSPVGFTPRTKKFVLKGILDLGKYEFNHRYILTTLAAAQVLGGFGDLYSGLRIRIKHPDDVRTVSFKIGSDLGVNYWSQDWIDINKNYFSAVQYEKVAIFIVLLCMVIVASFNISSTLFVNVLKKYRDIAILKAMGASEKFLVRLFVAQGLLVGIVGIAAGVGLGLLLAFLLTRATWLYVPAEIYKFDHLPVDLRWTDLTMICCVSILICWFSSLRPALKGARMSPVEGLRYE